MFIMFAKLVSTSKLFLLGTMVSRLDLSESVSDKWAKLGFM